MAEYREAATLNRLVVGSIPNRRDGKPKAAVDVWERAFKRAFVAAGMSDGHSHQLRDTFAVSMLENDVSLEDVSKMLGHTSIKTTEKHYAPWVKARQQRLNDLVIGTWKNGDDKIALVHKTA